MPASASLSPAYDLHAPLASPQPARQVACEQLPAPPVKDLVLGAVYKRSDPTRSEIDEDAQQIYQQQTSGLNSFENKLSVLANNYLKTGRKDSRSATCALDWLYAWAKGGAFLGEINVQGGYARQWGLATLSSAYLQVRDLPSFDQNKKDVIEQWLLQIAQRVMDDYTDIEAYARKQNNHLYWAAWAVTSTGIATGRRDLYEWGVSKVKYALHVQANEDGTLPLELLRGQKALQYHVFALAPLVMVSEAAMNNGEDLYSLNDGRLHKIIDRTLQGLQDPSYFSERSGHKQIPGSAISAGHFSWMEAYNARFPDPALEAFLAKRRPVISRRTGGDMTFLYGRKHTPTPASAP